jgi:6-phosphogluconolactonase (cycloisomerase 2 family)
MSTGNLTPLAEVAYVVDGATEDTVQAGAGIVLHPGGNALYASSRGDGAIIVYSVTDSAPYLRQVQTARPRRPQGRDSGGTIPGIDAG